MTTILVTGARGTVAAGLLRHLTDAGADVHAASSTPQPDRALLDLHDPATFAGALRGVRQVFVYANATTAAAFADAAAAAGVRHIVLLSSNAVTAVADPSGNPLAASFLATERALAAGPVPVTVLRPGAFNGNARQWLHGIRTHRSVDLPYPGARVDAVDERDIALVAYHALTDPGLRGGTFDLTGPAAISLAEQVGVLAGVLKVEVAVNRVSREHWQSSVSRYVTAELGAALLDYWQALSLRPAPITGTVADILGRPATSFHAWAWDTMD